MNADQIKKGKEEIVRRSSPWTGHCIHLGDGIYTFDEPILDTRLRRFLQIGSDIMGGSLEKLRVLDLACLEGHYGIEFALHGANVLGIEGREENLAKARFVKEILSLNNLELALDDVRNLAVERYGYFDIVLCLGILYHLDAPDVMDLVENLYKTCRRVAIIDTHYSLDGVEAYSWREKTYWGAHAKEHLTDATAEEKIGATWYSLDNPRSFHLTRASLCNLLRHVGFTSVYECLNPYEYYSPNWPLAAEDDKHVVLKNRVTLVAIKGQNQTLLSSPVTEASPEIDRPEKPEYACGTLAGVEPGSGAYQNLRLKLGKFLPTPVKKVAKKVLKY